MAQARCFSVFVAICGVFVVCRHDKPARSQRRRSVDFLRRAALRIGFNMVAIMSFHPFCARSVASAVFAAARCVGGSTVVSSQSAILTARFRFRRQSINARCCFNVFFHFMVDPSALATSRARVVPLAVVVLQRALICDAPPSAGAARRPLPRPLPGACSAGAALPCG